jgi:hypothetical protein
MPKLKIEFSFDEGELDRAIKFLHGKDDYVSLIKQDYFPTDKEIVIDFSLIKDEQAKYYHMNGMTALLITLQETQIKENVTN